MADASQQHAADAAQAKDYYQDGKYAEALKLLKKIVADEDMSKDSRLHMNVAVADYLSEHCQNPFQLLSRLETLSLSSAYSSSDTKKKSEEIDLAGDDDESYQSSPSRAILQYNRALVCFHLKRYATARVLLERLRPHVSGMNKDVGLRVCFLLLEIYFVVGRYCYDASYFRNSPACKKAKEIIEYLRSDGKYASEDDKEGTYPDFKYRLHVATARLQLLIESTKQAKKEIKGALDAYQGLIKSGVDADVAASSSLWWPMTRGICEAVPAFLKANMEYGRGNYRKSIRLLQVAREKGIDDVFYFNSMGCANYKMRQFQTASLFFSRAMAACASATERRVVYGSKIASDDGVRAHHFRVPLDFIIDIQYNSGVAMLMSGRPEIAFRCFRRAACQMHQRPEVWLRLAECCIAAWKKIGAGNRTARQYLKHRVMGAGFARRVIVSRGGGSSSIEEKTKRTESGEEDPSMSVAYANTCLRNALVRLHAVDVPRHAKNRNSKRAGSAANSTSPSLLENLGKRQILHTVLLNMAYVSLCAENPSEALRSARRLLDQESCSDRHRRIASFYAAEALAQLDRLPEAMKVLTPSLVERRRKGSAGSSSSEGGAHGSDNTRIFNEERAAYYVNAACVHALGGQFDAAKTEAQKAISANSKNVNAARLLTYVGLRCGDNENALRSMKLS